MVRGNVQRHDGLEEGFGCGVEGEERVARDVDQLPVGGCGQPEKSNLGMTGTSAG